MALLTLEQRQKRFRYLGLGEYNEENIRKFQKKYLRKQDVDGDYGVDTDNALRHVYNVKKYTKSFSPEEFKCECGGKYCCGYPSYMKKVELQNLQKIRDHYGKPMIVTCGLRDRTYNSKLSGSITNSKHLSGYACDFYMQGVTDTLEHRKASIRWIKTLPNHNYTYGNGINSVGKGVAIPAPYMGNALHTDTNKPVVEAKAEPVKEEKKQSGGDRIAKYGWKFAYHSSKDKNAKYPSGKAKPEYAKALDKYFGKNRRWSTPAKKGASCDVFVATCVRAAGLGDAPRGIVRSWLDKSENFRRVKNPTPQTVKNGDIISINWKNGNPHWALVYNGKVLEASYNGWYPKVTNTLKSRLSKSGKQSVVVYRAK